MEEVKAIKVVRQVKSYSEAFKRQVVLEIERGERTVAQVEKHYGINGAATVRGWLGRYGKTPRVLKVKTATQNQAKRLQEEAHLKEALAAACVKIVSLEALIECAQEHYGIDFKKSFVIKPYHGLMANLK